MNKLIQAEAMVKAERMYAQCKSFEEKKIIDKYAKLAGCPRWVGWFWGAFKVDELKWARKACELRLDVQNAKKHEFHIGAR